MTDTEVRSAAAGAEPAHAPHQAHPLDPATAAEFRAGRQILADAGLLTEYVRTSASSGSTPTSSTARLSRAASAAW
jgi:hypothetical protein